MPRKGHTEEQIIRALREAEGGKKVGDICREMGVSQQAFYSWKRRFAGLGLTELRELRQLREENRKLKTLVADLTLDQHILQEVLSKKTEAGHTSSVGQRDTAGIPVEREACLWADRDHTLDQPVPEPTRSANRVAHASPGAGRQQGPVRIPAIDRIVATGRLASEYEASLSVVSRRRVAGAHQKTCKASRARASFFT
jgi:putative transposase